MEKFPYLEVEWPDLVYVSMSEALVMQLSQDRVPVLPKLLEHYKVSNLKFQL
jgi:hypothetical protein